MITNLKKVNKKDNFANESKNQNGKEHLYSESKG